MGVKYGIEEPLNYWAAIRLLEGADPNKGRALGWGGLRLFAGGPWGAYDNIPVIKKGCVKMVHLMPQSAILMPGNWRSKLGLRVMNAWCDYPIVEHNQMWYLVKQRSPLKLVLFQDGMRVYNNGRMDPEVPFDLEEHPDPARSVLPMFERYVESFVAAIGRGEVRLPSAEDCWKCYYYSTKEIEGTAVPKGSEPGGVAHLFKHAAKAIPQGSLMWRALRESGLNPHNRWTNVVGDQYTSSDLHTARDVLTGYFRRRLGLLGAFHFGYAARRKETSDDDNGSSGSTAEIGDVGKGQNGPAVQPRALMPGV